jgi:hypothetical protein
MLPDHKNSDIASLPDRMAHAFFAESFKDNVSVSSAPPTWVRTKRSNEDDARQDDGPDSRDLDASHNGRRIPEYSPSLSSIPKSDDASEDGTVSTLSSSDGAHARRVEEVLDLATKFLQALSSNDTASEINSAATFEEPASPTDNISLVSSEDFYFQFPDEASSTSLMTPKSVSDLLLCLDRTPLQTPEHVLSKNANEKVEFLPETPPKTPDLDGFDEYFDWTPPKTPPRILSKNPSGELLYTWDSTPPQSPENVTSTYSLFQQLQHKEELGKLAWNNESPLSHHDYDDDYDDQQGREHTIKDLQDILDTFSEDSSSTTSSGDEERCLAIYQPEDRMLMKDPTGFPSAFDRIMDCFDPLGAEAHTYNSTQDETFDTTPGSFSDDCILSDEEEGAFLPCWNSDALDVCIDDLEGVTPEESTRWKLLQSQESFLGSVESESSLSESDLFLQLEETKHKDVDGTMTTTGESLPSSDSDTYHTFQTQEEQKPFRLDTWLIGQAFKM